MTSTHFDLLSRTCPTIFQAFNVLKYENMQHYDSHMDSFDPKDFGPQGSQRIATVLVYLSDVVEGGETVFKKEGFDGAERPVTDWRNCDDGSFKYKPRKGDAVLFWGVYPDGEIDPHSLHGGCPVGWDLHFCGSSLIQLCSVHFPCRGTVLTMPPFFCSHSRSRTGRNGL